MELKIFDVEHGFCSLVTADNRNIILIDCGYNSSTGFRPSRYLQSRGCTGIEYLIISNFDEDHIGDLGNIKNTFPINVFSRNRSLETNTLRRIKSKSGPISPAMEATLELHDNFDADDFVSPDLAGLVITYYLNSYPEFSDTNNLSLVTFLDYYDFTIIFPGDIENAGWKSLLKETNFRNHLDKVNVFVASHHGRESGYCEEVFNYCSPDIVVISDTSIKYDTQDNCYKEHASGVPFEGGNMRYVLTTRNDGMITISKQDYQDYHINIGG